MNQIREVIDQVYREFESIDHDTALIVCMERYAELYAKRCLEIAAENAECDIFDFPYSRVGKESITEIKLPEHI